MAMDQSAVEGEIQKLNSLREALVQTVEPPVDLAKFKGACGPVGKTAKALAKRTGWTVRQVSHKNRNPKNALNVEEKKAFALFEKDPKKQKHWVSSKDGDFYFEKIVTRPKCLLCHGPKKTRPAFVEKKYPQDRAYDFKVGDIRGLYSVFVPKKNPPPSK
jgi:hypothetical protein